MASPAIDDLNLGRDELLGIGGDDATIAFTDAQPRAVRVIFEEPTVPTINSNGEPIMLKTPTASLRDVDVPSKAAGATLRVHGRVFRITQIEPDSLGFTKLILAELSR